MKYPKAAKYQKKSSLWWKLWFKKFPLSFAPGPFLSMMSLIFFLCPFLWIQRSGVGRVPGMAWAERRIFVRAWHKNNHTSGTIRVCCGPASKPNLMWWNVIVMDCVYRWIRSCFSKLWSVFLWFNCGSKVKEFPWWPTALSSLGRQKNC